MNIYKPENLLKALLYSSCAWLPVMSESVIERAAERERKRVSQRERETYRERE